MDSTASDDYVPTFYIGHHDRSRTRVTPELLRQAQDHDYDMLTAPITTPHFHVRVLTLLINHLDQLREQPDRDLPVPTVSSLSLLDTPLAPGELVSQLLAVASPWIDLASPDPVIYNISRQVLELEVAYAAFCGIGNVILQGPKLHHGKLHGDGIVRYAYAIQEALSIGPYVQISISLPMIDNPAEEEEHDYRSLAAHARGKFMGLSADEYEDIFTEMSEEDVRGTSSIRQTGKSAKVDFFGTWDAWNVIRSICKYNSRLFVALSLPPFRPLLNGNARSPPEPPSVQSRWHSEPLRILNISKNAFGRTSTGNQTFDPYHRALLTRYMRVRQPPWLLLTDIGPIPDTEAPELPYLNDEDSMFADPSTDHPPPTPAESSQMQRKPSKKARDPTTYLTYLRHLQNHQPPRTIMERFGAGYQDYLQAPLQPLTDNLESVTYEVFEKDPVKYDQYLLAIKQALCDWRDKGKQSSGPDGRIVVAVVGAGRGPLITRALQASDSTGIPIEMWAVEKNPNAYVLLQRHNEETWHNRVNLVKSDMRSWKGPNREAIPPVGPNIQPTPYTGQWPLSYSSQPHPQNYPIDILISELLGSFADNELSPECLDGILPLLNPTHGLSIPHSYTAYLTPIAAPKLHADIATRATTDATAPNTPYVVMLHEIDYLSTTSRASAVPSGGAESITAIVPNVQPAWSFTHGPTSPLPAGNVNKHNERHARLHFNLRDRAVCHGLAGYFEAVLYPAVEFSTAAVAEMMPYPPAEEMADEKGKGRAGWKYPAVELSTNPCTMEEKSAGMMSWFPIYFPLKTPLSTPDFSTLSISIFRATDNRKVWYEWCVEAFFNSGGTGFGGKGVGKVRLGVSEVGSSRGQGCMM